MNLESNVASFDTRPVDSVLFSVFDVTKRGLDDQLDERRRIGWEPEGQPKPYGNGRRIRRDGRIVHENTHMRVTLRKVR